MLLVFGAGGFTRQIIDFLPGDTVLLADEGGGELHGLPILPFDEAPDADLVIAVASAAVRRKIALRWRGAIGSVVAPSAEISRHAYVAEGGIICRQAIIEADVEIGAHFHANNGAFVHHECQLGDFVTLAPGAIVCGACQIGSGAYIGAGAVIRQGLRIGNDATVGMGAVVTKDVPAGATVVGNPARMIPRHRLRA